MLVKFHCFSSIPSGFLDGNYEFFKELQTALVTADSRSLKMIARAVSEYNRITEKVMLELWLLQLQLSSRLR